MDSSLRMVAIELMLEEVAVPCLTKRNGNSSVPTSRCGLIILYS